MATKQKRKSKKTPPGTKRVKAGTSKAAKLTSQQEKFAQMVVTGLNQSDAYRAAYNAKGMKEKTINEAASRLMKNGKIAARVAELRAPVIAKAQYGLEQAMSDAETARMLALLMGQAAAAVSAATLKAKLNGLLVEDRKNERRPLEDLDDADLDRQIERDALEAGVSVTLQ